ncbi:MAG TPA: hypothetical protein VFS00_33030 [Polyangiaceae bacterium]|nr:hypothetical protein [Polyangiaceae bacterium]
MRPLFLACLAVASLATMACGDDDDSEGAAGRGGSTAGASGAAGAGKGGAAGMGSGAAGAGGGAAGAGGSAAGAGSSGAAGASGASGAGGNGAGPPAIEGAWKSACVAQPSQNFRLSFDIGPSDWSLDYDVYGDAACSSPFFTVRIEGPYELTGPSSAAAGAYEGRFGFATKVIVPRSQAAVDFLGSPQGCGGGEWAVGQATDVLASGCAALGQYPASTCPADYDLVARQGDELRFGARPADNDMCSPAKRPAALSPLPLLRTP